MNNKFTTYLLYAVGEIFLVMIGILLALQVNNWNENRKQKKELYSTFRAISNDLEVDTTSAGRIIEFYEDNHKNSLKIINREITKDNYKSCLKCMSLVTIYRPFNIQTKGFERLKTIANDQIELTDSLVVDITEVYSQFKPLIDKNNELMESEVLQNFNAFKSHDWFVDLTQGKFNESMVDYFINSEDYRTRVASHDVLAASNHAGIAKQYKLNAEFLLKRIKEALASVD
jgi:hypothetical protein